MKNSESDDFEVPKVKLLSLSTSTTDRSKRLNVTENTSSSSENSNSDGSSLFDLKKRLQNLPSPNELTRLADRVASFGRTVSLKRDVFSDPESTTYRIEEKDEKESKEGDQEIADSSNESKVPKAVSKDARARRRARIRLEVSQTENRAMVISQSEVTGSKFTEERRKVLEQIERMEDSNVFRIQSSRDPFPASNRIDGQRSISFREHRSDDSSNSRIGIRPLSPFPTGNIQPTKFGGYRPLPAIILKNLSSDSESGTSAVTSARNLPNRNISPIVISELSSPSRTDSNDLMQELPVVSARNDRNSERRLFRETPRKEALRKVGKDDRPNESPVGIINIHDEFGETELNHEKFHDRTESEGSRPISLSARDFSLKSRYLRSVNASRSVCSTPKKVVHETSEKQLKSSYRISNISKSDLKNVEGDIDNPVNFDDNEITKYFSSVKDHENEKSSISSTLRSPCKTSRSESHNVSAVKRNVYKSTPTMNIFDRDNVISSTNVIQNADSGSKVLNEHKEDLLEGCEIENVTSVPSLSLTSRNTSYATSAGSRGQPEYDLLDPEALISALSDVSLKQDEVISPSVTRRVSYNNSETNENILTESESRLILESLKSTEVKLNENSRKFHSFSQSKIPVKITEKKNKPSPTTRLENVLKKLYETSKDVTHDDSMNLSNNSNESQEYNQSAETFKQLHGNLEENFNSWENDFSNICYKQMAKNRESFCATNYDSEIFNEINFLENNVKNLETKECQNDELATAKDLQSLSPAIDLHSHKTDDDNADLSESDHFSYNEKSVQTDEIEIENMINSCPSVHRNTIAMNESSQVSDADLSSLKPYEMVDPKLSSNRRTLKTTGNIEISNVEVSPKDNFEANTFERKIYGENDFDKTVKQISAVTSPNSIDVLSINSDSSLERMEDNEDQKGPNTNIQFAAERSIAGRLRRNISSSDCLKSVHSGNAAFFTRKVHESSVTPVKCSSSTSKLNYTSESKRASPRFKRKSQERFPFTISEATSAMSTKFKITPKCRRRAGSEENSKLSETAYKLDVHPSIMRLASSGFEETPADILNCVAYEQKLNFVPKMRGLVQRFSAKWRKSRKRRKVNMTMETASIIYENHVCREDTLANSSSEGSGIIKPEEITLKNIKKSLYDQEYNYNRDGRSSIISSGNSLKKKTGYENISLEPEQLDSCRKHDRDDLWVQDIKTMEQEDLKRTNDTSYADDRYTVFLAKADEKLPENKKEIEAQSDDCQREKDDEEESRTNGCLCLRFWRMIVPISGGSIKEHRSLISRSQDSRFKEKSYTRLQKRKG